MLSYLKTPALALLAVFAPAKAIIVTIIALCFLDLVVGIIASKKPITSKGLKRTPIKIAVYLTAALSAFLVEQYLTPIELPVMKMVTGLIGMTELKSVLENLDTIAGGNFFQSVVNSIQARASRPEEPNEEESPPEPPKAA